MTSSVFLLPLLFALGSAMVIEPKEPVESQTCGCPTMNVYVSSGSISSPSFKGKYCNNLDCEYKLIADSGKRVELNFLSFDTEVDMDTLTIYDGDKDDDGEVVIATLSGHTTPTTSIISGRKQLTLRFQTDNGGVFGGWSLRFFSVSGDGCGQKVLSGSSAVIKTPNHPYNYPDNAICSWTYTAPSGTLAMVSFSKDADTEMGNDVVTVTGGSIPHTFSGLYGPTNFNVIRSTSRSITVTFHSDDSIDYTGFSASFSSFIPSSNCSCGASTYTITDPSSAGIAVQTPNYGNGPLNYCHNLNCQWTLIVPVTYNVELDFVDFAIETGYDRLTIENDINGALLETCSGSSCRNVTSSTRYMTLNFRTDGSVALRGFQAIFRAHSP